MLKQFEGHLHAEGFRFGLIVSRFNEFISGKLLTGALDALKRHEAMEETLRSSGCRELLKFPYRQKNG